VTTLDHVPRGRTEGEEDAVEIDGEDAAPLLGRELEERRRAAADARVGEAGVDPAELGDGAGERLLDRLLVGDVAAQRQHALAMALELLSRRRVLRLVGAPDAEVGAARRQRLGHAEADAAVAAGDEGDLAAQVEQRRGAQLRNPERGASSSGSWATGPA
jgi:hypothetical protein